MPFVKTTFTIKKIFKQLKNDLWCKEVATGYTTSYTWEANQLGHFAIGFAPTIILTCIATAIWGASPWLALVALFPILFMLYKEKGDVQNEVVRFNKTPGVEPLNISDIKKNAWTANVFSMVGAIVAGSVSLATLLPPAAAAILPLITLLVLCIPCFAILKYWIAKKICFQQAGLPYTYRLSYFAKQKILGSADDTEKILKDFQNGEIDHLIVSGPIRSGKTSLITAIGTELSFRQFKVRYLNFLDFLDISLDKKEQPIHVAYVLWDWKDADIIIFDDVDYDLVSRMKADEYKDVLKILKTKKIVWGIEEQSTQFKKNMTESNLRIECIDLKRDLFLK